MEGVQRRLEERGDGRVSGGGWGSTCSCPERKRKPCPVKPALSDKTHTGLEWPRAGQPNRNHSQVPKVCRKAHVLCNSTASSTCDMGRNQNSSLGSAVRRPTKKILLHPQQGHRDQACTQSPQNSQNSGGVVALFVALLGPEKGEIRANKCEKQCFHDANGVECNWETHASPVPKTVKKNTAYIAHYAGFWNPPPSLAGSAARHKFFSSNLARINFVPSGDIGLNSGKI